jgi:hypothetical protein
LRGIVVLAVALPLGAADIRALLDQTRHVTFPELSRVDIQLRTLRSRADFFRARPRFPDFFRPAPMRYVLFVNPAVSADSEAIQAIIAHELEHISYYSQRNRWRLLGLVRLLSTAAQAKWERATDRRAVARGYGPGLIRYREWLYRNVSAKTAERKKRIYLTPEEIERAGSQLR